MTCTRFRLRCLQSGYYSRWLLTEAMGGTFADVEIGMEPTRRRAYRAMDGVLGRRWYRRVAEDSLAGLRKLAARQAAGGAASRS